MALQDGQRIPAVLTAVRESTGALHRRLEQRLPFFSNGFDHDAYQRLLMAYYGFHAPLEQALASHLAALDQPRRMKTPALQQDLLALGLSRAQVDALPRCQDLPAIHDDASALGVMYVIEGSTLGGQVLKRAMAERLEIDEGNGGAFLDVYGQATGPLWRAFLHYLDAAVPASAAQHAVVKAAVDTFSSFERWLESREVLL